MASTNNNQRIVSNRVAQQIQMMSEMTQRMLLAQKLGSTHEGERDTYKSFGYPKTLRFSDYLQMYERDEMAGTIADFIADETWRNEPVLIDGETRSDAEENLTPFLEAWISLDKRLKIISMLNNVDIYNAFSQYSVILLGAPGNYDTELQMLPPDKLFYLSVHNEGNAEIKEKERNTNNRRYGLPLFYDITFEENNTPVTVHWSRIVHFKEGNPGSRTHGVPRMKRIFNRLIDWEKVMGGAAEAFWLSIAPKTVFTADEDADLPVEGSDEMENLDDQIEALMHNIHQFAKLVGVKMEVFPPEIVSAEGQGTMIAKALSVGSRIPNRTLMGNEAGELASTQDDYDLADYISTRQNKHAEDGILRPFVDRMVELGTLPAPSVGIGQYVVEWPSLFQLTENEEVALANQVVNMINTMTGGLFETFVDIDAFLDIFYKRPQPAMMSDPQIPEEEDEEDDNADFE